MASTTTTQPRIAIIGGGPGGLVLLLTLHKRGVPATLYEREDSYNARAHLGGTLDLGWESGQRALRENGLEEAFKAVSRPEGDEFKISNASGDILLQKAPDDGPQDPLDIRPEVDRSALRKILLDALPADSVKWGHALSAVRPLGGGQHELTFANGFKTVSDVLVGSDGAFSRVRPLVSDATPLYHGVTGAEISIAPEVAVQPHVQDLVAFVGEGSVYAAESSHMFAIQRNGDGRIRAYAWFRGSADWSLPHEPAEARKALLEIYNGWTPMMLKMIENCDENAIYQRPLYYLPVGHRWKHVPGVTLIGDAAHLLSPFAGAGANLAMVDGFELGIVLADAVVNGKSEEEREAAVAVQEEKMLVLAEKYCAIALGNLEAMLNPEAPASAIERIKGYLLKPETRREA